MTATAIPADTLRAALNGPVLVPGDTGYDVERRVWNGMIDRHPAVIAQCRGVADVVAAVRFAREHELPICVRGGGHGVDGKAMADGALAIDLSLMNAVWVDPAARRAVVQGGARWTAVDRETQLHGLATTGGTVSNTGVGGLTLGGGLGWLMRKHGTTVENLLSMDVVTVDGEVTRASDDREPRPRSGRCAAAAGTSPSRRRLNSSCIRWVPRSSRVRSCTRSLGRVKRCASGVTSWPTLPMRSRRWRP